MKQVEIFSSVNEFMQVINTRPENDVFADKRNIASITGSKKFTQTESMQEADSLFRGGWLKGKKYLHAMTECKPAFAPAPAYKRERKYAGRLNVGALINGADKVFIKRQKTLRDTMSPVVSVFYDLSIPGCIEEKYLAEASGKLFSAVRDLENEGYKIELNIGCSNAETGNETACMIKLKNSGEALNEVKMLYPCVHPSFFRRHIFRWLETTPLVTERSYSYGHGRCFTEGKEDTIKIAKIVKTTGKKIDAICRAWCIYRQNMTVEQIKKSIKEQRAEAVK